MVYHTTPHVTIVPTTIPPIFEIEILEIANNPTAAINPAATTKLATNHLAATTPAANTNLATNNMAAINPAATTNLATKHLAAIKPAAPPTLATTNMAAINPAAPTNLATNPKAANKPAAHTNLATNPTAATKPAAHNNLATSNKAAINPAAPTNLATTTVAAINTAAPTHLHTNPQAAINPAEKADPVATFTLANNNMVFLLPKTPRQPAFKHTALTPQPETPTKDTIHATSAVLPTQTDSDLQMHIPLTIPLTVLLLPRMSFLHIHDLSNIFPRARSSTRDDGKDTGPHLLLPEIFRRHLTFLSNHGRPLLPRLGSHSPTVHHPNRPDSTSRIPNLHHHLTPLGLPHIHAGSKTPSPPHLCLIRSNLSSLTFRMIK
jgi:hypothetical protein